MAQGRRIFTISVYMNKRGEQRLAVQMPYSEALRIATDDIEALDDLRIAINRRITLEESREAPDA